MSRVQYFNEAGVEITHTATPEEKLECFGVTVAPGADAKAVLADFEAGAADVHQSLKAEGRIVIALIAIGVIALTLCSVIF